MGGVDIGDWVWGIGYGVLGIFFWDGVSGEEFGEFEGFGGQGGGSGVPGRVLGEQVGVFEADHGGAGAAGEHDRVVGFQGLDGALRQAAGFVPESAVEEGLAAAGLGGGEVEFIAALGGGASAGLGDVSEAAQQFDGGRADFGHDLVHQAGDEEGEGFRCSRGSVLLHVPHYTRCGGDVRGAVFSIQCSVFSIQCPQYSVLQWGADGLDCWDFFVGGEVRGGGSGVIAFSDIRVPIVHRKHGRHGGEWNAGLQAGQEGGCGMHFIPTSPPDTSSFYTKRCHHQSKFATTRVSCC